MKLFLLACFCAISLSAFSQTPTYTISFAKDGSLENQSFPTVLYNAKISVDHKKVEIPDSKLLSRFKDFLKAISDTQHPLYDELDWERRYLKSVIDSYTTNQVIGFEQGMSIFLPLIMNPEETIRKVTWKGKSDEELGVAENFIVDGDAIPEVKYELSIEEQDNQFIARHLDSTARLYKGINPLHLNYIRSIRKEVRREFGCLDQEFLADSLNNKHFNLAIVQKLDLFENKRRRIENIYKIVNEENKNWIKSWVWYSRGKILLNPFEVTADTILVVNRVEEQLQELSEELKLWENVVLNDPSEFETADKQITMIHNQISDLNNALPTSTQLGAKYRSWMNQVSIKNKKLYSGVWHASSDSVIRWMRHYDSKLDFEDKSKADCLPAMVASQDRMVVHVHNLKESEKVKHVSTSANFQPKSPLQETLEEVEKQFSGLAKTGDKFSDFISPGSFSFLSGVKSFGIKKGLSETSGFPVPCKPTLFLALSSLTFEEREDGIRRLLRLCTDVNIQNELINLSDSPDRFQFMYMIYNHFGVEPLGEYRALIQDMRLTRDRMEWLLNQTKPPLKITLKDDETVEFRTEALLPEKKLDITASSKVTSSIFFNDEKEPEVAIIYKKYHRTSVLPTIGLAYVPEDRTGSVFDPATKQFMPGKRFDNVEVLVGVKYYPFKTNPVRNFATTNLIRRNVGTHANFKRGNHFVSKLFLTGGLGVRHEFLRNYYAGAGMDLFPGVNIHVGSNLILRKYYQLENAEIKREQQRPKGYWYFSLSLDPGIVASLTNIFIR